MQLDDTAVEAIREQVRRQQRGCTDHERWRSELDDIEATLTAAVRPLTLAEVARRTFLGRQAARTRLNRLRAQHRVKRVRDPSDRRVVRYTTPGWRSKDE